MYVCICKGITDQDIRAAVENGASSMRDLRKHLGAATQCGKCTYVAKEVLSEALSENLNTGLFYAAAS